MFAFALWDSRARAAAARARPGRQEAAVLDAVAATRSWFASELRGAPRRIRRVARRARPRARSTPTSRFSTCPHPLCAFARRREAAAGIDADVLDADGARRSSATGRSTTRRKLDAGSEDASSSERLRELIREATRDAPDERRAARRVPVRRRRLERRRRGDGGAVGAAGEDVLDRLRRAATTTSSRYARLVAERYGTDHHEFRVEPRRARDPAQARLALRRAVRGLLGDPELLPRRADQPRT